MLLFWGVQNHPFFEANNCFENSPNGFVPSVQIMDLYVSPPNADGKCLIDQILSRETARFLKKNVFYDYDSMTHFYWFHGFHGFSMLLHGFSCLLVSIFFQFFFMFSLLIVFPCFQHLQS